MAGTRFLFRAGTLGIRLAARRSGPSGAALFGVALSVSLAASAAPGTVSAADNAANQPVAIIRNDRGGSIELRLRQIEALRASGTRVEIRGFCASSCTLLLDLPNTCVTRASRLAFHGPQTQYYGVSLPPAEFERWSRIMANHYPARIRAWFLAEARQQTMTSVTITGSDAIRMGARPCI